MKLNKGQKEVVEHRVGPAAICAVAGSGKTRSVVERIAAMVKEGEDPQRILAITFTKKASEEMNSRLKDLGCNVQKGTGMRVGTFHSVGLEIVRDGSPWEGYEVDSTDKMRISLKIILGYQNMKWEGHDLTEVLGMIDMFKNELISTSEAPDWCRKNNVDHRFAIAYFEYEEERHRRGLLTFGDMVMSAVFYLQNDQSARDRWQVKFRHVMVDEYQDTNSGQITLCDLLSKNAESFMVVGDDDQAIYEWRGARPSHMVGFSKAYEAKEFFLDVNYRSKPEIIEVANRLIIHNEVRIPKQAKANAGPGGAVQYQQVGSLDDEADLVVDTIREQNAAGKDWGSFAILYRTNAQSRAFEEVLLRNKIPHIVIGGTDFYRRKEIKYTLSYIRLIVDDNDDAACKGCINRPWRFIGKYTLEKIERHANASGKSWMEVVRGVVSGEIPANDWRLNYKQKANLKTFVGIVDNARIVANDSEQTCGDVISHVLDKSGYWAWIIGDQGTDTSENSRISNLRELIRTAERFQSLQALVDHVAKMKKERDELRKTGKSKMVQLMSIHKAKGLEFNTVFVAGVSQGVLPHARSNNIEEERRLFYVAMTRAEDFLMVTSPTIFGEMYVEPSAFIAEAGLKK
jgi:DNA helicase-2/ATP-dependent DNA helicase PcrA